MSLESMLATARARELLATTMSSAEARMLPADVRASSLWSARVNHLGYVRKIAEVLDQVLSGRINHATARDELQHELDLLGYDPETGFAELESSAEIPPAERGSLTDQSSARRINLMVNTQEEIFFGRGQQIAGATRLETWPAWELVRVRSSRVPRDWPARWKKAAEAVAWVGVAKNTDRQIALKTSPIWAAIGSADLFPDALNADHPPFAYNSGKGWEEMRRDEIKDLEFGKADPSDLPDKSDPTDQPRPVNAGLKTTAKGLPRDILEVAKKDLAAELEGDELRYRAELDAARAAYLARSPAMARRLREEAQAATKNRITAALAILNAGTSEGARKGWETRRRNGWTPRPSQAPKRITVEEADALLTRGFTERDRHGQTVRFGLRLKTHIEDPSHLPADIKGRKEHLNWARATVRTGHTSEVPHDGQLRKLYSKVFTDHQKRKGFLTIVDIQDGEAYSIFRIPARRAEGLANREEYQTGEQPPGYVLRAVAAAGRSEDYLQHNVAREEIKA